MQALHHVQMRCLCYPWGSSQRTEPVQFCGYINSKCVWTQNNDGTQKRLGDVNRVPLHSTMADSKSVITGHFPTSFLSSVFYSPQKNISWNMFPARALLVVVNVTLSKCVCGRETLNDAECFMTPCFCANLSPTATLRLWCRKAPSSTIWQGGIRHK